MTRLFVTFCVAVMALFSAYWSPLPAWSQEQPEKGARRKRTPLKYEFLLGPAASAALQIQALTQHKQVEAQIEKDFAEARERHANAAKLEGEAEVQDVMNRIKIREIEEADRARRIRENIAKRKENNAKTWDRLKHHPELTSGEILTGGALNFLKNRLSTTLITYQPSEKESAARTQAVSSQLQLTPTMIHALQVRQLVGRGESLVFRLDEGRSIQVDWWPPALRIAELKTPRLNFERARNELFEAQTPDQFYDKIKLLLVAHAKLEDEFLSREPHAERVKNQNSIHDYLDGKAVLRSKLSEIRRLHRVGPGQTAAGALSFKSDDLTELLTHMVRNGLEFAPPKPGDEPAYQQVFHMLRDLYVATQADADETAARAVRPQAINRFSGPMPPNVSGPSSAVVPPR